jgi:hypothetical protein
MTKSTFFCHHHSDIAFMIRWNFLVVNWCRPCGSKVIHAFAALIKVWVQETKLMSGKGKRNRRRGRLVPACHKHIL